MAADVQRSGPISDSVSSQRARECAESLPQRTGTDAVLATDVTVVAAVVCREAREYLPREGLWQVQYIHKLSASERDALVTALRSEDRAPERSRDCPLIGYLIPPFALELSTGEHVEPRLPSDGCAPTEAARDVLGVAAQQATFMRRIRQLEPESQAASGCYDGTKYRVPTSKRAVPASEVRRTGDFAVCLFDMSDGSGIENEGSTRMPALSATGQGDAVNKAIDRVLESFVPGWPADCTENRPTASLTVGPPRASMTAESRGPSFYLEVGGCSLVANAGIEIIGSADPTAIGQLAALATDKAASAQ